MAAPARPAADGFTWEQFRILFRVMRKGENNADDLGMTGLGGGARSSRRVGARRTMPLAVLKAVQGLALFGLAAAFFYAGMGMGPLAPAALLRSSAGMLLLIMLLTGVYAAVNLLYFARDNRYYLTLPAAPTAVMWAKLANYILSASAGSMLILPLGLGALWSQAAPPDIWARFVLAFAICALTANLAVVALTMALMRFSRFAHDKDRFSRLFGVVVMVLALCFGVGIQVIAQSEGPASAVAGVSAALATGPASIALGIVCPPALLAAQALSADPVEALLGLGASLAGAALWFALVSVLASRWYLEGMRSFTAAGGARRTRTFEASELGALTGARSALAAALDRDWKTMLRTPVFFNQFVLGPLLMPVYFIAIFAVVGFLQLSREGVDLDAILAMVTSMSAMLSFGSFPLLVAAFGLLLIRVFMGMGGYAATLSVSRDGEDFFFLRALPVDWRTYLVSKLLTSIHGDAVIFVLVAVLLLAVQVPLASTAYLLVLLAAASLSLSLFSIAQGAFFPRLHWENEAQVVKGGSAFVAVYLTMILGALACALPGLALACRLFSWVEFPNEVALVAALGLQLVVLAALAWVVFVAGARSLSRRES